ncbi:tyrosine-type recombinase/integrase [Streptomyces sp. NPDC005262]|uniref:tyrosine-type recombinase/integrase n=1 Tax=Streptomyces sp. NPDC005262 TaxID=3364710 RepID=UPI003682F4E0
MSTNAPLRAASSPFTSADTVPLHCAEAEYAAFTDALPISDRWRRKHANFRRRFVRTYPDLPSWFALPLRVRLGWRNGEGQNRRRAPEPGFDTATAWINFNARHYLTYLALTGRLRMDWGWLLGIGVLKPFLVADQLGLPMRDQSEDLRHRLLALGHVRDDAAFRVPWGLIRLVMHRGDADLHTLSSDEIEGMRHAIRHCERIPGLLQVVGEDRCPTLKAGWGTNAYRTGLALFHAGITGRPPAREETVPLPRLSGKPRIDAVFERFLAERALVLRPESMSSTRGGLRRFGLWLDTERPHIASLDQLNRADLVDFMDSVHRLHKIKHPDQPLSRAYRAGIISTVAVLFRYAAVAEWDDVPARPLITHADMPRVIERVPRFIPADQLGPVMDRVRALGCPLQRCALLVARWSGARRTEIRKLHLDCLDVYPDGTPRLRLAAGKALKERTVPLHEEAAEALRTLAALRQVQSDRGIHDPDLGRPTRYLFLRNGVIAGPDYLFAHPLRVICEELAILNGVGKPAIHPHRFRHTLGTQLAEKGARVQTIMKVLGHKSPGMSMTYTHISDPTVLADYQAVLQPGATIAGPLADTLRSGQLDQDALDWLKTNFYKTELELGRCLRLPQEGPCECDLYLSCAKFVTTPQYATRLRERLCVERQLITDATDRGWEREIDRHRRVADRITSLLDDLGEPHDEPAD